MIPSQIFEIPVPPPPQPSLSDLNDSLISNRGCLLWMFLLLIAANATKGGCDAHRDGEDGVPYPVGIGQP